MTLVGRVKRPTQKPDAHARARVWKANSHLGDVVSNARPDVQCKQVRPLPMTSPKD